MFRLSCGEFNNSQITERIKAKREVAEKYVKQFSTQEVKALILESLDEKKFNMLTSILTLGELIGFDKRTADMLYFICVVNRNHDLGNYPILIESFNQGKILYKATKGNLSELMNAFSDFNKEPTYMTIHANHKQLLDENRLSWRIPIFFYRDGETGEKRISLLHPTCLFATVESAQIERTNIPRVVYLRFLKEVPNIITKTDEIRVAFDETSNNLLELLNYLGYETVGKLENIRDLKLFMEDNTLTVLTLKAMDLGDNFQQISYNKYYYKDNVIPYIRSNDILLLRR